MTGARRPARGALLVAAVALAVVGGGGQPARAQIPVDGAAEAGFQRAAELRGAGHLAEARAAFEALAAAHPSSPLAADALFEAARLAEDELADPVAALALFERLASRYPDARTALAAERRAAALAPLVAGGAGAATAAAALQRLRLDADRLPLDDVVRRGDALIAAHPDWAGAGDVLLLLADRELRAGRAAAARRRFAAAAARGPTLAALAREGEARAALAAGDLEGALIALAAAAQAGAPAAAVDELRAEVARDAARRRRARAAWIALPLALAGLLASLVVAARRAPPQHSRSGHRETVSGGDSPRSAASRLALWPPPREVGFVTPPLVLLAAVGFTDAAAVGPTLFAIGGAGVVAAWLSGAALRLPHRHPLLAALVHIALSVALVVSATYLALGAGDLLDLVAATVELGPGGH